MVQQCLDQTACIATEIDSPVAEGQTQPQHPVPGETTGFWEIWQAYQDSVFFPYCLRLMKGNYADAEDVLSVASFKAWKGLQRSAQKITNIKGWLGYLVRNQCIDACRARDRHNKVSVSVEDISGLYYKMGTVQDSTEDVVLRHEMELYIRQAIDRLPPRLCEPARLRFLHDMPCRDIAVQLDLSPENVRKRLQQARALLQESLRVYLADL